MYGTNVACMVALAVSADKWEGTSRAKEIDNAVTIIQLVTLVGEWIVVKSVYASPQLYCYFLWCSKLRQSGTRFKLRSRPYTIGATYRAILFRGAMWHIQNFCCLHFLPTGVLYQNYGVLFWSCLRGAPPRFCKRFYSALKPVLEIVLRQTNTIP